MMKILFTFILATVFTVGFCSCEFSPSGINHHEIEPVGQVVFRIDLNSAADTIALWSPVDLEYSTECYLLAGENLYRVNIVVENDGA